jgi:hypothetical protein
MPSRRQHQAEFVARGIYYMKRDLKLKADKKAAKSEEIARLIENRRKRLAGTVVNSTQQ